MTARPDLAPLIDHTLLAPDAVSADIDALCEEALKFRFATVCVASRWVHRAAQALSGSDVGVCSVVGFPHGDAHAAVKAGEANYAVRSGAREVDMVIPRGALLEGDDQGVLVDVRSVVDGAEGRVVKVILETAGMPRDMVMRACALSVEGGATFVKTSTGYGSGGATVEAVRWMREAVGPDIGVKASGGIRDAAAVDAMVAAGATRIGASSGVAIVSGGSGGSDY